MDYVRSKRIAVQYDLDDFEQALARAEASAASIPRVTAAVVEPTASYTLCGESVALVHDARKGETVAVRGQGIAPALATIDVFKQRGLDRIPTGPGPDWATLSGNGVDYPSPSRWYRFMKAVGRQFGGHPRRAGRHPGTHEIGFDSAADTVALRHTARNREGFARGALKAAQWIADKKGISIAMEPASRDAEVFCDAEAVHQILSNLLDNALKYTPDGGSIVVAARAPDDDFVEIEVRDTGIGIPHEELPRLFERFYRVDKARSRELGGTGLGLAIVKHLVRAQGGDIRVESQVNKGSTFAFTLPVQESASPISSKVQQELTIP